MSSKDVKPKQRLGQAAEGKGKKIATWVVLALVCAGGAFAAYRYTGKTTVEVPVAKVRMGEFVISVKTRGEVKSVNSVLISAPQVPEQKS